MPTPSVKPKEEQEHRGGHRPALTQRFVPQQVGKCSRHDLDPTQVDAVLARENGVKSVRLIGLIQI